MATRKVPFGEYIKLTYGIEFKKGQLVECGEKKKRGVVTDATHHVHVRLEGQKHSDPWHPSDVSPVHELVDGTLYVEEPGIIGRCTCGWTTGHRFSRMVASAAFADHKEA